MIKKKYILPLIAGLFSLSEVRSQNTLDVSADQVFAIKTIDWKKPDNDFGFFNEVLFQKKILILSESDHGHGSSADAQCAILKSLIDSSRSLNLYIESSWINCNKIMSLLRQKGKIAIPETEKYIRSFDMKYWVSTGFWNYLAEAIVERKLSLYGFDIDGISPEIVSHLFNEALELKAVQEYSRKHAREAKIVKACFLAFEGWGPSSVLHEGQYKDIENFINIVLNEYKKNDEAYFNEWKSILDFFYWIYRRSAVLKDNKYSNQIKDDKQFSLFHAIRDSLMAEIFIQYYNTNPREKTVCTMSAYHGLRNSTVVENLSKCCKNDAVRTMGEIIDEQLRNQIYNVCFISMSGRYGINYLNNPKYWPIKKPIAGSLEKALANLSVPYCFINLESQQFNNKSFYMNTVFDRFLKSNWSKNYSGVFFIREMNPLVIKD